jgi:cytochrome c oxidase subunit 2
LRTPGGQGTVDLVVNGRTSAPLAVRVALCALALLLGGCAWDGPMSTVTARSDFARAILSVYSIVTWTTAVIGLLVFVALLVILVRFRARPGDATLPRQVRGHTLLEISWTIGPALALLIIAIPTIQIVFRTQTAATPPDALVVVVRGFQWWWEFRYPDLDVVTANELHLPAGRRVALRLEGPDVIHSFWVPQLGGKRDVIPGRLNQITLTADQPGEYWGQCAEFCGASHANMGMRAIVQTAADFDRWVAQQKAPPAEAAGAAAAGKALFAASACVGCHTIKGVSTGVLGPDLTHFGSRRTLAAGMWPNTPENVAEWLKDPPRLKPGVKMPALGLTDEQAKAMAAYLTGLK